MFAGMIAFLFFGFPVAFSLTFTAPSSGPRGLISLPTILRRGYDKQLICVTICASGAPGQTISGSIIRILMGDIMGVSVGDLYIGAVVPGFVLVGRYTTYLVVVSWWKPGLAPAIPAAELAACRAAALRRVTLALLPALRVPAAHRARDHDRLPELVFWLLRVFRA